ncbi:hypothetical protein ACOMHN_023890 [Nucella lapillus]
MIPSTGGNLHTRRARGAPQVPHWRCLPSCSGRRVRRGSPGPVRGAPDSCLKSGPIERGAQWGKGDPPIGISFSTAPRGDGETRFSRKATPVAMVRGGGARDERDDSVTENGVNACVRTSSRVTSVPPKAAEKMAAPPQLMEAEKAGNQAGRDRNRPGPGRSITE